IHVNLASVDNARGRYAAALAELDAADAAPDRPGDNLDFERIVRGQAKLGLGDAAAALALVEPVVAKLDTPAAAALGQGIWVDAGSLGARAPRAANADPARAHAAGRKARDAAAAIGLPNLADIDRWLAAH